jgi:hypothetical protein
MLERKINAMKEIIHKLLSGRWILTIICGLVFAYVAVTKIIPPEASVAIISMVFQAYFTKERKSE